MDSIVPGQKALHIIRMFLFFFGPYLESKAAAAADRTDLPPSLLNSFPVEPLAAAAVEAEGARRMKGVVAPPLPFEAPAWLFLSCQFQSYSTYEARKAQK